ncbi:DUF5343 domain-containing protein [Bradyrhizobium monzae]|uniref:DUF5343 domain-containing protein n=1 Tax=Bradyrhizobium sp. Oc8 TaxID=2876780 RepID=UPI001F215DB3|nr:DUF5343 domain-containing protein [Bradyrhizobium sp. Oc8]
MPASLPYLASNKNVSTLFTKIASAKVPPKFTHDFLKTTIGLASTNDRQLIPLMRNLGFLDQSNTPTTHYTLLKGDKSKAAIADGIKIAYAPLFNADEKANKLSGDKLKSLVAQVAGSDDDMTARISATFSSLVNQGDFEGGSATKAIEKEKEQDDVPAEEESQDNGSRRAAPKGLRTEFQYVIQVQLPSNGTEETYLNIFNAIRKTFV